PRRGVLASIGEGLAAWLPALPLIALAIVFLVVPTIELIVRSFYTPDLGWTLSFWQDTLTSNGSRGAISTSVKLGLVCATISLAIGSPLAWAVSRMITSKRSSWLALLNVGANFGGIGLAFGYMAALGTYGMVTLAVQKVISGFVPPEIGSFTSLVMAYSYTNVPLYVLLTLPAMGIIRTEWMEAAETCSASRLQFWRHIGLPVLAPFLLAGWLLIFTWSIGLYGLAYALGRTASTTGELRLITLQIGLTLNTGAGKEERAYVLAVVLLLLAAVALLAYRLMLKRALRWFN
ncbi:MAG: ABC transporter permease, partial [Chloroflexota bacterium]